MVHFGVYVWETDLANITLKRGVHLLTMFENVTMESEVVSFSCSVWLNEPDEIVHHFLK